MPNRRRRKLSTAMSAVAALAVASPCAYFLVYESTSAPKPPEHHEFKQAAVMTDLPNELMGALSQGLSQFGVNLPPIPALAGGTGTTGLTSPGLGTPGLTSPGLGTPGLASPGLGASPALGAPGLTSPGLGTPGLTSPGLSNPGLPGTPGMPGTPGLTTPGAMPTMPGAGLNPALANPGLTSPAGLTPGGTGFGPSEVPISADPGAEGTYPILGDPSTLGGASPIGTGGGAGSGASGGLVSDVMQAANQLGAGQAIDLLKGLVMPAIMQARGGAALPGAVGALPGAAGALPGVAGALPGAAGALPGAAAALPPALPPV
ncbi:PirG [Mycobacterium rhizamassiliense]|uniref:PirG n=1 Tax=Mycobacterium rhizamassiliense TaxID=1841860 RepID=UPI001FE7491C|nr:PirG [Mycobacterium rhizamassiliense]